MKQFWPLVVFVVISLILYFGLKGFGFEPGGFLENLNTELIGILITVFYVNSIVRRQEAHLWKMPRQLILERFIEFAKDCYISLRLDLALKNKADQRDFISRLIDCRFWSNNLTTIVPTLLADSNILDSKVQGYIETLNHESWASLSKSVRRQRSQVESLLSVFGSHLSPNLLAKVLRIDGKLSSLISLLGLPEGGLLPPPEIPEQFKALIQELRGVWEELETSP